MNGVVKDIKHNMRILWLWILIVIVSLVVWSNTQTASLTDVFEDKEVISSADMILERYDINSIALSTLKQYNNLDKATLRISFFVDDDNQNEFQNLLQSSYWFFVTNHHNTSIVTLYLPSEIKENTALLLIQDNQNQIIIDSVMLFQWEAVDDIRLENKNSYQVHE